MIHLNDKDIKDLHEEIRNPVFCWNLLFLQFPFKEQTIKKKTKQSDSVRKNTKLRHC